MIDLSQFDGLGDGASKASKVQHCSFVIPCLAGAVGKALWIDNGVLKKLHV